MCLLVSALPAEVFLVSALSVEMLLVPAFIAVVLLVSALTAEVLLVLHYNLKYIIIYPLLSVCYLLMYLLISLYASSTVKTSSFILGITFFNFFIKYVI